RCFSPTQFPNQFVIPRNFWVTEDVEKEQPAENRGAQGEGVGQRPPIEGGTPFHAGLFLVAGHQGVPQSSWGSGVGSFAVSKEVPQPQERAAFGLSIRNPASDRLSE